MEGQKSHLQLKQVLTSNSSSTRWVQSSSFYLKGFVNVLYVFETRWPFMKLQFFILFDKPWHFSLIFISLGRNEILEFRLYSLKKSRMINVEGSAEMQFVFEFICFDFEIHIRILRPFNSTTSRFSLWRFPQKICSYLDNRDLLT